MAFNYLFRSCDPFFGSINSICSETRQTDYEGKIVAIQVQVSQDETRTAYYTVEYLGENTGICFSTFESWNPVLTQFESCEETKRESFDTVNCSTGELKVLEFQEGVIKPTNEPCEVCSEGFTYNAESGMCERITQQDATFNGSPVAIVRGSVNAAYGWGGGRFYETIDARPYPITELSNQTLQDGGGAQLQVANIVQGIWDNTTGSNGRLNQVGVWGNPNLLREWIGFTACVDVPRTKQYVIGMAADNRCRFRVNGELLVQMSVGSTQYSFNHWHLFPVTLQAGLNIIEMEGYNDSSIASFGAEIYDATPSEMYEWDSIEQINDSRIFTTEDLVGGTFQTGTQNGWSCPDGYSVDFCAGGDVPVCTLIEREDYIPCEYGVIKTEQNPCDCVDIVGRNEKQGEYSTVKDEYQNCRECNSTVTDCEASERTLAYAVRVKLPDIAPPDRGFKECCYDNVVLAKIGSSKDHENDYNGFFFKRQMAGDDCDFVLKHLDTGNDYALNNSTYGEFTGLGGYTTQPNLTTYIVEWQKVLATLGTGFYQIEKQMTIAGIPFTELSNTFRLEHFTNETADHTVRIDTVMDGLLVHIDTDFKGTGFRTSLRTEGYFGNRNPKYKQDNLVKRNYDTEQISMEQSNEYQYQTGLLPICITEELYDFILFGNELFVSDYNRTNHSYFFSKFAVEFSSNKGAKYYVNQRHARANLVFKDREKNKRKLNC